MTRNLGLRVALLAAVLLSSPLAASADTHASMETLEAARSDFMTCGDATTTAGSEGSYDVALTTCMAALARIEESYAQLATLTPHDRSYRDAFRSSAAYLVFANDVQLNQGGLTEQACIYGRQALTIIDGATFLEENAKLTATEQADILRNDILPTCNAYYSE